MELVTAVDDYTTSAASYETNAQLSVYHRLQTSDSPFQLFLEPEPETTSFRELKQGLLFTLVGLCLLPTMSVLVAGNYFHGKVTIMVAGVQKS